MMNTDVKNFIEAVEGVELAKRQLWTEQGELKLASEALTKAFFTEGSGIPTSFAIQYGNKVYLIRIDTEGDHGHQIQEIDAIVAGEPAQQDFNW